MVGLHWSQSDTFVEIQERDQFTELRQLSSYRIEDVSCSRTHLLAVTAAKEVLAWVRLVGRLAARISLYVFWSGRAE